MKKFNLIIILLLGVFTGFAQNSPNSLGTSYDSISPAIHIAKEPRFLINMHSAYSVGMGSTFKFYPDDISSIRIVQNGNSLPSRTTQYSNPTKGLGDGFKIGFGVSYILNDFINVGLDFDYFNSTIKKNRDSAFTRISVNSGPQEYYYNDRTTISYEAKLLTLTPNITFKAIARPKWFLYNKLGAIITFRPTSTQKDVTNSKTTTGSQGVMRDSFSTVIKKYDWSIRNPAYGFMAALGTQVKLGEKLRGFAELQFSHVVFVIQKKTLTDYIVDNRSIGSIIPVNSRELVFVRSFTSTNTYDPNRPAQTLIQRIPITYLGLQVGLAWPL